MRVFLDCIAFMHRFMQIMHHQQNPNLRQFVRLFFAVIETSTPVKFATTGNAEN